MFRSPSVSRASTRHLGGGRNGSRERAAAGYPSRARRGPLAVCPQWLCGDRAIQRQSLCPPLVRETRAAAAFVGWPVGLATPCRSSERHARCPAQRVVPSCLSGQGAKRKRSTRPTLASAACTLGRLSMACANGRTEGIALQTQCSNRRGHSEWKSSDNVTEAAGSGGKQREAARTRKLERRWGSGWIGVQGCSSERDADS